MKWECFLAPAWPQAAPLHSRVQIPRLLFAEVWTCSITIQIQLIYRLWQWESISVSILTNCGFVRKSPGWLYKMLCVLTALLLVSPDNAEEATYLGSAGEIPWVWQRRGKLWASCIAGTMSVWYLQPRVEYSIHVSLKRNVLFTSSLVLLMVIPLGVAGCCLVFPWHTQIRNDLEFRAQLQHYRNNLGSSFSWLSNSAVFCKETQSTEHNYSYLNRLAVGRRRLLLHLGALVFLYTTKAELSSFILLPELHNGIKTHGIQIFPVILV